MGIRGLANFLKWRVPSSRRAAVLTGRSGQRWAIDCSCLMYRARGAGLPILAVIAGLIVRLREAGIEPVFVFDGRPPAVKSPVTDRRREERATARAEVAAAVAAIAEKPDMSEIERVDHEIRAAEATARAPTVGRTDRDRLKQFLYAAGVLFVTPHGEADDLLALLARAGVVSAVVSTDMDMLARGVECLVVPEVPDASVLTEFSLRGVLTGLRLTYRQFVDACALMGSDYSVAGGQRYEPAVAVEAARRGVWDISGAEFDVGTGLLRGEGVTLEGLLAENQMEKWVAGAPARELAALTTFCEEEDWPAPWRTVLLR
jgi:flap endonuclease-1